MDDRDMAEIICLLEKELERRELPIVSQLAVKEREPFKILISTLLSLRTKDEVTEAATERLFALASTPEEILQLTEGKIAKAIFPVGFYRKKAEILHYVCRDLIGRFHGRVPDTIDELLTIKGVGRKTANLVVALGFNGPGLCVDTHVHRISNRLGYVHTRNPEATEFALREKLPQQYWLRFNTLLVAFGRNACRPISPFCSRCPIAQYCDRVGVTKSR